MGVCRRNLLPLPGQAPAGMEDEAFQSSDAADPTQDGWFGEGVGCAGGSQRGGLEKASPSGLEHSVGSWVAALVPRTALGPRLGLPPPPAAVLQQCPCQCLF